MAFHLAGSGDVICPGCAARDIDTPAGFCTPCVLERAATLYATNDRTMAEQRAEQWRQRATSPDARLVLLRQHRSRTLRKLRPSDPIEVFDPWALAIVAVDRCNALGRSNPPLRRDLDAIAETLRRLAWGPDDLDVDSTPPRRRRVKPPMPGQLTLWEETAAVVAA